MLNNIKNKMKWINGKTIAVVSTIAFVVSMLPNWGLAFIARPTGDDYGYSAATHQIWLQTHSLLEVIKTGIDTTISKCTTWNGDWFSVFIFTLMPEVFVYRSFWIVPIFWSLATIGGTFYLFYQLLTNTLGLKWYETLSITMLTLLASYQWIPSSGIGLYWYVGVIHYIMPHVIALFMLGFLVQFLRTKKIKYIVFSAIGMIAIGGSSYYSTFLVMLTYVLVFVCGIKKERKMLWLSLPVLSCLIALYFQITAPGNAARVGESIEFSIGKAINTIMEALFMGVNRIWWYITESPYILLILLLIAVIIWCGLVDAPLKFEFKYPILFVGYMYGIYASMYTPEIYSQTDISGGPPTMEYLTFLLVTIASIVYVEGWIISRLRERDLIKRNEWYYKYCLVPYVLVMCIVVILYKGEVKETLFYESVDYIMSGAAADFAEQMRSQEEILLDDSIKNAYLCPTNDQQGPLLHMPVIDDPDAFTNTVVKKFYGKDYVVTITDTEN